MEKKSIFNYLTRSYLNSDEYITANWRAVPLETREIVVELISHTTTRKGLTIQAELDTNTYEKGLSVTKKEFDGLALTRNEFHGEWNYTISPHRT